MASLVAVGGLENRADFFLLLFVVEFTRDIGNASRKTHLDNDFPTCVAPRLKQELA